MRNKKYKGYTLIELIISIGIILIIGVLVFWAYSSVKNNMITSNISKSSFLLKSKSE